MTSRYRFEGFELDTADRVLLAGGEPVRLSSRQFDLLVVLVSHRGAVVSKDELLNRVWPGQAVEENNAAVHVSALRRALGRGAIETLAGRGYRFVWPVQQDEPARPAEPPTPPPAPVVVPQALPSAVASLHGRSADLQSLLLRCAQHRLVTVVGAPGLGKSALALACAHQRRYGVRDGAVWVDLLREDGPVQVVAAVAQALGLDADTELPQLLAVLRPLELLIVLDNAEVAAAQAAVFCHAVLEGTEGVSLMVTSRRVLRVAGERLFRPGPLSVPQGPCDVHEAMTYGAVALFVDQVRAQDQCFALGPHNVAQVVALCRRLDGLPLAIQLAAGRLNMFGIDQLTERLDDRFRLLTRGTQAGPRRHRSLRAALDASHALLTENERLVLRRLEPFEGGFTLDMVVAAVSDQALDAWSVADALEGLADHSLVMVDTDERPRYRLLDGIRAYCQLLVSEAGETDTARRQHARTVAELFERADRALSLMPDSRWLAEFGPELPNLRAALDWCLVNDPSLGVALLGTSRELFCLLSLNAEARWRHAAYEGELPPGLPPAVLARFCIDHARLLVAVDAGQASAWFQRGVSLWRSLDDRAQRYLALSRQVAEDRELSMDALQALVYEIDDLHDEDFPARVRLWGLAAHVQLWQLQGRAVEAGEALRASMLLATDIGASDWLLSDLQKLTTLQLAYGQPLQAGSVVRQLAAGATGEHRRRALGCLAVALLAEGHTAQAREVLTEYVEEAPGLSREAFDRMVPAFAWLAFDEGRHNDAAQLMGFAGRAHPGRSRPNCAWRSLSQKLRARLDCFKLARLQGVGSQWSEADALSVALSRTPGLVEVS